MENGGLVWQPSCHVATSCVARSKVNCFRIVTKKRIPRRINRKVRRTFPPQLYIQQGITSRSHHHRFLEYFPPFVVNRLWNINIFLYPMAGKFKFSIEFKKLKRKESPVTRLWWKGAHERRGLSAGIIGIFEGNLGARSLHSLGSRGFCFQYFRHNDTGIGSTGIDRITYAVKIARETSPSPRIIIKYGMENGSYYGRILLNKPRCSRLILPVSYLSGVASATTRYQIHR